jgi:pyruvate ferredoxin oxidoreductase beta subunit
MNTGIQRSSSTPWGASTTTSPSGKESIGQNVPKKNLPKIVAAHDIPYLATACPSYPLDLMNKTRKALDIEGPTYLHVLSPCPTGWRHAIDMAIEMGRLAVETGVFPLYEIVNGRLKLDMVMEKREPVIDYLKPQGRFRHLKAEQIEEIQKDVDSYYEELVYRAECDAKAPGPQAEEW